MLPRKVIQELFSGLRATCLHILVASDRLNCCLIVLKLPFETVGQCVVKSVGPCLSPSARKFLQLGQAFRFQGTASVTLSR